jgi:hypothetical protein
MNDRPNEKGVVEGTVKYTRLNYFVPVPQVHDLEELNAKLLDQCRDDMKRRLRGGVGTKAELLIEDQAAFILTILCRLRTLIMRYWPKDILTVLFSVTSQRLLLNILVHGASRASFLITVITFRYWNKNRDRLITLDRWQSCICRNALTSYVGVWWLRRKKKVKESGSTSGYSDFWMTIQ